MSQKPTHLLILCLFMFSTALTAQCEWFTTGTTGQAGNNAAGVSVATDGQGNTYLAGNYTNVFSMQGQNIANLYVNDPAVILAKFNSAGVLQWMKPLDSPYFVVSDLAYRGGNLYLTGNYVSYVTINGQNFSGQGENGLILKFDGLGNTVWGRTINSPSSSYAYDIAFINDNNFIFTGRFRQSVIVNGNQITGSSGSKNYGLYGKMDTDGNLAWMKTSGESGNMCQPNAVAVDPSGTFYLGGIYRQGLAFGNITAPVPGSTIASLPFVAKFSSAGDVQWLKTGTFPSGSKTITSDVSSLMVAPNGDVLLTGFLDDAVDFMGQVSWGESTALMMRILSNGNLSGSLQVQSTHEGTAFEYATMDVSGNLYLGGTARGNLFVRVNNNLHSMGYLTSGYDIMLAKFSTTGFTGIELIGGPGEESSFDGLTDNAGRILVAGQFAGTFSRNGVSKTSPNGSTSDLLLLKICTFSPSSDISDPTLHNDQLSVYPNPATDQIQISAPEQMTGGFYRVFDLQGRLIQQGVVSGANWTIPVATWQHGWYTLQVQKNDHQLTRRMLIQD